MPEPATPLIGLTAAGITIVGIATGIHPAMLIAGLAGGLWAMSYNPPAGTVPRLVFLACSSLVAGYLGPLAAAVGAAAALKMAPWWPSDVGRDVLQYPIGFVVGFLAIRWLGPALLRRVEKAEAVVKGDQ